MEKGLFCVDWKNKIMDEAKIRGYSRATIRNYIYHVGKFLASGKAPKEYLLWLVNQGLADETIRSTGFAIRFYLKLVGLDDEFDFPNLKREKKIPIILSKKEIEKMISSINNVKHRLIILITYATGMRASEVANLRWGDIDFKRNTIHIRRAKGKKDRIVMLSPKVKKKLKALTDEKEGYVFLSFKRRRYTLRSIEQVVYNAAQKAGIKKKVSPHTLRHSFATHLLDCGIDIRHIKDLLGHANLDTTMIYTKVSNKDLARIKSPID